MSEPKTHRTRDIFVEGAIAPAFVAESIAKHASQTAIGAHEIFLGQVRADVIPGSTRNRVEAIEYTAYRDMANEQMTVIREEAFARWPQMTCLHVHHSQGVIKAGELCFMVFASAPHRQQAREAVAFVTDEVKKRLPVFGKEIFVDGDHHWKVNS
ncbi:MAG: molybdenum cofactor biosynthesis protein MoaE [Flavobacteriales bacterium]|nr:molybdenum cofactor biosynthesis protein MoaE [Flavobacteriales bacterium]